MLSEEEIRKAMEVYKGDILKKIEFDKIRQSQEKELSQWENANFKAAGFISRCCKPHIRQQLPEDITAQELWEYLKRYSPKGWTAKWHVIRRIEELEYKKTDTLAPFYSKLYELYAEAKTIGITFDDFILMKYLLNIDKNYNGLILRTYDKAQDEKDLPSLQHIHERAIEEEARWIRRNADKNAHLNLANKNSRTNLKNDQGSSTKDDCKNCGWKHSEGKCPAEGRKCNGCHKKGHYQRFCPNAESKKQLGFVQTKRINYTSSKSD